jgi:hypothetical protein
MAALYRGRIYAAYYAGLYTRSIPARCIYTVDPFAVSSLTRTLASPRSSWSKRRNPRTSPLSSTPRYRTWTRSPTFSVCVVCCSLILLLYSRSPDKALRRLAYLTPYVYTRGGGIPSYIRRTYRQKKTPSRRRGDSVRGFSWPRGGPPYPARSRCRPRWPTPRSP